MSNTVIFTAYCQHPKVFVVVFGLHHSCQSVCSLILVTTAESRASVFELVCACLSVRVRLRVRVCVCARARALFL